MTTMPEQNLRQTRADEQARIDANTFRLQQQFMQAHGAPTGPLTTLVTTLMDGGLFLCSERRRQ